MVDPKTDAELLSLISEYRCAVSNLAVATATMNHVIELQRKYEAEVSQLRDTVNEYERKVLARLRWPGVTAAAEGDLRVVLTLNEPDEVPQ